VQTEARKPRCGLGHHSAASGYAPRADTRRLGCQPGRRRTSPRPRRVGHRLRIGRHFHRPQARHAPPHGPRRLGCSPASHQERKVLALCTGAACYRRAGTGCPIRAPACQSRRHSHARSFARPPARAARASPSPTDGCSPPPQAWSLIPHNRLPGTRTAWSSLRTRGQLPPPSRFGGTPRERPLSRGAGSVNYPVRAAASLGVAAQAGRARSYRTEVPSRENPPICTLPGGSDGFGSR
jgi:hypothetical protein